LKENYDDLDKLKVFTIIKGTLINESPLRVGVGREPSLGSAVDTAILRVKFADGNHKPIIPGSSLKGTLRSLAEAIAKAQEEPIHNPWDASKAEEEAETGNFCVICGLFGSTKLASHVRVYDAYPLEEAPTFIKTGVGLNRDFQGVQPGILYTEEFVAPGVRWRFRMDVINVYVFPEPRDKRGKLLRQVIDLLSKGLVQVGARKTIGYGLVRLEKAKYEVYEVKEGLLTKIIEGEI
jgi:CRISPR-associated RAMP protein (TIGR02581 family)